MVKSASPVATRSTFSCDPWLVSIRTCSFGMSFANAVLSPEPYCW